MGCGISTPRDVTTWLDMAWAVWSKSHPL